MRGGGGGLGGLTLGLAPFGPVDLCMQTKNVRVRPRPSASAEYIKPGIEKNGDH